jgi:hypothetical protein
MLVVEKERLGAVAFARLAREHVIHEVLGDRALPRDVRPTRALRTHLIAPLVPEQAWVTGLAALWLLGLCAVPRQIDLAGKRGLHLTVTEVASVPLVMHTGPMHGLPTAPAVVRVAVPARACIDALAHSPAALALPATASGLKAGLTTTPELREALAAVSRHTTYRSRVASLIGALDSA